MNTIPDILTFLFWLWLWIWSASLLARYTKNLLR